MGPPCAVVGGVGIAFLVGVLVVDAVGGTQKMGPPSRARLPQTVMKYSSHLGS